MGKFSIGAGIRGSTSGDSDDNGFYTSAQGSLGGGDGNFGLYGGGQANISWQGQMTGGSVYGGVTYTPVGNKNFNPSFYTYGAGAKGQYEDGSWKWQATVSANFDNDRYQKAMLKAEHDRLMSDPTYRYGGYGSGLSPQEREEEANIFHNQLVIKENNKKYTRSTNEKWKEAYARDLRMRGIKEVEYEYDTSTGEVTYLDGTKFEDGSRQIESYNIDLAQYGDSIEGNLQSAGKYLIIGDEALGSQLQYGGTSTVSRGKDILNDRMTVMRKMENGKIRIIESYDASAEPTHYVRNSSGTVTGYQDVSPFISSRMRAGKHQVYTLVRVRKQEPNLGQDRTLHNNQKYLAFQFVNSGHMLHTILEGSAWNNSEGCAVIMEMGEAYYDTINMFKLSDSLEIYDVNKYGYFYMNRK